MEHFRLFMKTLLETVDCEFRSLQIVKWEKKAIDLNYWISKEFVTMENAHKIEQVLHDYNMRVTKPIMFFPDTSMARMHIRVYLPLEDNIVPSNM